MLTVDQNPSRLEFLMATSAALAVQTLNPEDFRVIPTFLAATLHLPLVNLAIVKIVPDGSLILFSGTSAREAAPSFEQDLLDMHQQTRREGSLHGESHTALTHAIDEQHRLLLIVHGPVSAEARETLQLIVQQLGKCLESLIMWTACPQLLGQPFDRLTDREWMVLRSLNSDAGEKQLADQLGLSPHTLHSHIKSIYRKVGVQGRLSLLRRVEIALRDYRMGRVNHVDLEARSAAPAADELKRFFA